MPHAAIYIRVSTEDQASNNSLATQELACRAYATARGLTVLTVLSDDETGSTMTRPGFTELRRLASERLIQHLIVYSVDRLHRNLVNQVTSRSELQGAGVTIHYVRRGELKTSPEDVLFDNIDGVFAEYERHKIRERTMRGVEGKVVSGRVLGAGRAPYGYQYDGSRAHRTIAIHDEQAAIVRELYERYAQGTGVSALAADLSARQIPTWSDLYGSSNQARRQRQPFTWNQATIYDILHDELYAGVWQQFRNRKRNGHTTRTSNPGDWVGVPVPAIVDRPLWLTVQAQLERGSQQSTRNTRYVYGLRSMIRCAHCGGAMTGMTQVRSVTNIDSYYRCVHRSSKAIERCTESGYVHADRADLAIWELIRARLDPEVLAAEVTARQVARQQRLASSGSDRTRLMARQTEIDRQIDKQLDLYRRDVIDLDSVERAVKPLRAQRDDLDRQLAALRDDVQEPSPIDLASVAASLQSSLDLFDTNVLERRSALLFLRVQVTARRIDRNRSELSMVSLLNYAPLKVVV